MNDHQNQANQANQNEENQNQKQQEKSCRNSAKESERILKIFHKLDAKNEGFLTVEQFELYFKLLGKNMKNNDEKSDFEDKSRTMDGRHSGTLDKASHALNQTDLTKLKDKDTAQNASEYSIKLVEKCDLTFDGKVTFEEFRSFVTSKEIELFLLFKSIAENSSSSNRSANDALKSPNVTIIGNTNHDTNLVITKNQLQSYLWKNKINLSNRDLDKFLDTIGSSNNGVINFNQWRDFFFLLPHPVTSIKTVFQFYNSFVDVVDFNSDSSSVIPLKSRSSSSGNSETAISDHFKYLLAGGIAGAVSRTVTAPLDRLKVLLQTSTQTHRSFSQWVSIKKGIFRIYKDGGILSFFKGNGLNIIKIMPESALKFYIFEMAKDTLCDINGVTDKAHLGLASRLMAGGLAGLVSQSVIYPIETIKTRIMSQISNTRAISLESGDTILSPRDSSITRAVKTLYREGGAKAFYRGCGPALLGIIPYAGVDLAVFETLKNMWMKMYAPKDGDGIVPIHVVLGCGMFSGSCGAIMMYPLSLVRTRLQAQGTPSHPTYYSSVFDVVQKTYANEGLVGFYRGLAPTLLKVLPAVSISYLVYERTKTSLELS